MKVLFVASECTPIAKVGGLGDVIGSLPKALADLGVEVKIAIPFYQAIDRKVWRPKEIKKLRNLEIDGEKIRVYKTRLPLSTGSTRRTTLTRNSKEVEVYLVYNKKYLSTGPVYFEKTAFAGSKKEIDRFLFFSKAVFSLLVDSDIFVGWDRGPDIVHCHDWHTGALVKALRNQKSKIKNQKFRTVFTIHNLANQGVWRGVNLMAEGIKNADVITTVSPTYAKEILTKEYGDGLGKLLLKRKKDLVGILNGIDYDFWPFYPRNKKNFQKVLGLEQNKNVPIFGLVSRLTYQKGINLIVPLAPKFVKKYGAQFVFLGQGELKNEKTLAAIAKKYPQNVFTKIGFDEKLAHQIYAQSDFFLMPSIFEPSGLGQMISMHYGTVPIVRATGGLKDSVKHLKTGFVFGKENAAALSEAMKFALEYFADKKKLEAIRQNCLKQDFSWTISAEKYLTLYKNSRYSGFGNQRWQTGRDKTRT